MAITSPTARLSDNGGYEYQFVVTPPDWLMCNICHYPSKEPYLSDCCGNTFCKSCLEGAKRVTVTTDACPVCRNEDFVTFQHKQADRIVRGLYVFCTNKRKGCEWQGEVNSIHKHLVDSDGCQFEVVVCSNNCKKCIQRQHLTSHLENECVRRKVDCQHCHITEEHQFIEGKHKEQCPKFPVACPNKCEAENMPREDIDEHRKMCPLEEVTCPNDCGMKVQQQYLVTHVKIECPHLKVECQYCWITGEQKFIENKHKEMCSKYPVSCPNKCEVGSVPRHEVIEHMKICPLELIQCEYHVVGCGERMARKDQKKHNKEKMEEHLSLTTHQLFCTQQDLAGCQTETAHSREVLTAKISQARKDLTTTTNTQIDTVKTIDKLIIRIQQIEKDLVTNEKLTASQLEKYKGDFSKKLQQIDKKSAEQLAVTKHDVSLNLQETQNNFKEEFAINKEKLKASQKELAFITQELKVLQENDTRTKQLVRETRQKLEEMTKALTNELGVVKKDISHVQQDQAEDMKMVKGSLKVTQQQINGAKSLLQKSIEDVVNKTKGELSPELLKIKSELIQVTDQTRDILTTNIAQLEKTMKRTQDENKKTNQEFHQKLLLIRNEVIQTNTAALDELMLAIQNLTIKQEDAMNREDNIIQRLTSDKQEFKKMVDHLNQKLVAVQQEAKIAKHELTQKLTNTETQLNITKQQLSAMYQNLTKTEKQYAKLVTNTDEALAKLETKFQTKINEIETTVQKKMESKLEKQWQEIELSSAKSWYANLQTMASKLSSGDQIVPVVVNMVEYSKTKRNRYSWFSDSFYTHSKGYKMCWKIATEDSSKYLSMSLFRMQGPYDDQLKWPLRGLCEVKLLNQIGDWQHYTDSQCFNNHPRTIGSKSCMLSWTQFISHEDLQKCTPTCQYLKDDSIFLQVDYKVEHT